jgi:hypothetical protein
MIPVPNLMLAAFLLAIGVTIAEYLWHARRIRVARRKRLEQRIAELGRIHRLIRERPTLNTRGRAP